MQIGAPTLLAILFIALKLMGVITWSWVWVLSPLWIAALIWLVVVLVILAVKIWSES